MREPCTISIQTTNKDLFDALVEQTKNQQITRIGNKNYLLVSAHVYTRYGINLGNASIELMEVVEFSDSQQSLAQPLRYLP